MSITPLFEMKARCVDRTEARGSYRALKSHQVARSIGPITEIKRARRPFSVSIPPLPLCYLMNYAG